MSIRPAHGLSCNPPSRQFLPHLPGNHLQTRLAMARRPGIVAPDVHVPKYTSTWIFGDTGKAESGGCSFFDGQRNVQYDPLPAFLEFDSARRLPFSVARKQPPGIPAQVRLPHGSLPVPMCSHSRRLSGVLVPAPACHAALCNLLGTSRLAIFFPLGSSSIMPRSTANLSGRLEPCRIGLLEALERLKRPFQRRRCPNALPPELTAWCMVRGACVPGCVAAVVATAAPLIGVWESGRGTLCVANKGSQKLE